MLFTRRDFERRLGGSLGLAALASMLQNEAAADGTQPETHHPATAKAVIWLFMNGGPSGIDTFDPKPVLEQYHGKPFPGEVDNLFPNPGPIYASPFSFDRYGESGQQVCELLPHLAEQVDDICFLNACTADSKNHGPASYQMCSGMTRLGHPSVGAWTTYGLGRSTQNLPDYVVMQDRRSAPEGGANLWSNGYLPANTQGVPFRSGKSPVLYSKLPEGVTRETQKRQLEFLRQMNREHYEARGHDELLNRIETFETAFQMQIEAPAAADLSGESRATHALYGLDDEVTQHFGTQLLMARRLIERGVRFIQVFHGGASFNWDSHQDLETSYQDLCVEIDKPIAGLLRDLDQRGLLDSTLVVWNGEFGRLPVSQNGNGRDHNPHGFVSWLAGGGIKRGLSHGQTDEFGYKAVEGEVHVHDLHATILHTLGLDHARLTFPQNGRDMRLTDVYGSVVEDILSTPAA